MGFEPKKQSEPQREIPLKGTSVVIEPVTEVNETFSETIPQISVDTKAVKRAAADERMVAIRPRKTLMRTNIGGVWYNLIQNKEQFVPAPVRDWLMEKGVL